MCLHWRENEPWWSRLRCQCPNRMRKVSAWKGCQAWVLKPMKDKREIHILEHSVVRYQSPSRGLESCRGFPNEGYQSLNVDERIIRSWVSKPKPCEEIIHPGKVPLWASEPEDRRGDSSRSVWHGLSELEGDEKASTHQQLSGIACRKSSGMRRVSVRKDELRWDVRVQLVLGGHLCEGKGLDSLALGFKFQAE